MALPSLYSGGGDDELDIFYLIGLDGPRPAPDDIDAKVEAESLEAGGYQTLQSNEDERLSAREQLERRIAGLSEERLPEVIRWLDDLLGSSE